MSGVEQRVHHLRLSGGTRVGYAIAGSGPPLLCLPGWVSDLELGWAFGPERRFYEALATGRTLIRYDRPGSGRSEPIGSAPARSGSSRPDPYHSDSSGIRPAGTHPVGTDDLLAVEVEVIGAVLEAVGVASVDLIGSSLSAPLAVL